MDVKLIEDPAEVLEVAADFFRGDPFTTNVITTQLTSMLAMPTTTSGAIWAVAREGVAVRGVAMHTPPMPVFLSRMDPEVAAGVAELIAGDRAVVGVSGESASVGRFSETWNRLTGSGSELRTAMRMYVLTALVPPNGVPGTIRCAEESDLELITAWVQAFQAEAQPGAPAYDPRGVSERRLRQRSLWLWCDGEAVSLAGVNPASAGVARVGPVYTPPAFRRRGYAGAATAGVTQAAVDAGAANVVLYTDLANPTSNSIYQALGYVPHHDAEERDFR